MVYKTKLLEAGRKEEADGLIRTIDLLLQEEQSVLELGQLRAQHQRTMAEQRAVLLAEILEIEASPKQVLAGLDVFHKEVTIEDQKG